MKNIILFPLVYLLNFIKTNKVKTVAIGLLILLYPVLNSLPDVKEVTHVVKELNIEGSHCYFYFDDGDLEMRSESKPLKLTKGNNIVEYKYNDANIFIWIIYTIAFIMAVVGIFANDDETNYQLDRVFSKTVSFFTKCEVEDGRFYYYFGNKLIGENSNRRTESNIANYFGVRSLTELNNCPEWKSIQRKRENILNKLGI
jgi:hypothetical protein